MLLNGVRVSIRNFGIVRACNSSVSNGFNLCQGPLLMTKRNQSYIDGEYIKTSMTQYNSDEGYRLQISSFNEYGFTINGNITAVGPIVLFPKTIFSWNIEGLDEVNEKSLSLFKHLEPKVDILVIGTGDRYSKINPEIPKWLIKNKISNFEILPTDKAINAYNFLIGENRFAAGAFIPAYINNDRDESVRKHIERQELYKEIETAEGVNPFERLEQMKQKALDFDKTQKDQVKPK